MAHMCLKLNVGINLYFFVNGALSFPFVLINRESLSLCFYIIAVVFLHKDLSRLWLFLLTLLLSQRVYEVNSDSPVDNSTCFLHEQSSSYSV